VKIAPNPFRAALAAGKPQVGVWSSLASPVGAEILAGAGFDWVLIDMEHSVNELPGVLHQLQIYAGTPTHPVVRPPWNEPVAIKRLLDQGVFSLLLPMVQDAAEARAAVAACRYPPRGLRGVSLNHRGNGFGAARAEYLARWEDEVAVLVQIETRAALAEGEAIAAVDGVTGVFFGPADLSADFGHLGQPAHPEVTAAIRAGGAKVRALGKPAGILAADAEAARVWLDEGFGFVAGGADSALLAQAARGLAAAMRAR
jgi:4-hydroxy-2-oxoheptanedioate aldolase